MASSRAFPLGVFEAKARAARSPVLPEGGIGVLLKQEGPKHAASPVSAIQRPLVTVSSLSTLLVLGSWRLASAVLPPAVDV